MSELVVGVPPDDRFGASGTVVAADWHAVGGGVQAALAAVFRTGCALGRAAGDHKGQWHGVRYPRWRLKRDYLREMLIFDASRHDLEGGLDDVERAVQQAGEI